MVTWLTPKDIAREWKVGMTERFAWLLTGKWRDWMHWLLMLLHLARMAHGR